MTQVTLTQAPATQAPAQSSVAQATQATQATQAPALRFMLANRPERGNALFAHTAALFAALGLFEGATIPRATLVKVWGATAVKYHAQRFEASSDGLALNDAGFDKFGEMRTIDPEAAAAYFELMTTGKTESTAVRYTAVKPI